MSLSDFKTSAFCPHCNQHSLFTLIENNVQWQIRQNCGKRPYCVYLESEGNYWWMAECHSCNKLVLILNNGERIYPSPQPKPSDENIPENVRKDLNEAKMCMTVSCFRASTAMCRRALETCCIDKGADENKNLQGKIEELFTLGILTTDIKDWANTVRWVGNDAVHINANEVGKDDAEDILKLAEQIFHIVYIAPAIAQKRQIKRSQSKSKK
ncbi:MAG: DUF4145 domain-containing protein [Promethearchaeota archaeon]